ncbi:hypothetical protein ACFUC1_02225 [Pedococcus sp. NPDC057267]|uniref:hypothetical protein n=1 Tax=Pedococcus sp. NPDC057267 TaxID=3346077 RepID=UPI00362CF841
MSRLGRPDRHGADPTGPEADDQVVRQYRYLLRTAPVDALEHVLVEALEVIGPDARQVVLTTVQAHLLTGAHLRSDDITALAHLCAAGERQRPGALTGTLPATTLHALAREAINSEAAFGLFGGYAAWDGSDPEPPPEHDDSEYGQRWHASLHTRDGNAPGMNGAFGGT